MSERTKYQKFEAVEIHRSQIKGAPYNPRGLSPANRSRLKKGIKKHGIVDTLVYNVRTGQLVGGHQRLSVLDELEGKADYTLTVQQVDVDENEEKLLNLSLNNPSLQGYFEADLQRELFEFLLSENIDIEGAGYTTTDVQTIFPDIFASMQLGDQLDAEMDIVNELHEMNRVGKEHEEQFRENLGLEPTKAMLDKQARADARESPGGAVEYDDVDLGETPTAASGGEGDPENPDWKHDKEFFKGERNRTVKHNADVMAEADVLLTLSFQTKAQMLGFLQAFGIEQSKRYLDIHDISAAFGVEL